MGKIHAGSLIKGRVMAYIIRYLARNEKQTHSIYEITDALSAKVYRDGELVFDSEDKTPDDNVITPFIRDKHGTAIKIGDILRGEFYGMGGVWPQCAIVVQGDHGPLLELECGEFAGFDHPKFRLPERREIIPCLPHGWVRGK